LGVNVSPQGFSERINLFTVHVNPYLGETELKGKRLGEYILEQLPEELGSDVRTLRRDLIKADELTDPDAVTKAALELIEQTHNPKQKVPADLGASLVCAALGYDEGKIKETPAVGTGGTAVDALAVALAKVLNNNNDKLFNVAAAATPTAPGATPTSGRAKKRAAKRAAQALAAVEAAKKAASLKGGFRLPPGQRCSKGTCDFRHDEKYPGKPCYRDPRWRGPLPRETWENEGARNRIIADREVEAKRIYTRLACCRSPWPVLHVYS